MPNNNQITTGILLAGALGDGRLWPAQGRSAPQFSLRCMIPRYWPIFQRKAWGCSATEVEWRKHGFEGSRLGYLLNGAGFFHQAHRAVDDCHALLEILFVQNRNKRLDPFERIPILFAGIHNAIPIALQRFRFHFAQVAGQERRSNGLGSGV